MSKQKPKKQITTGKHSSLADILMLFTFSVLIIFLTTSKLTNEDDYFWHLATGRYIVQNGSIPSQDVFSYPTLGQPWLVTEWGWDVLTYEIFNVSGYTGLSILNTLVFLVIFLIFFLTARKFKVSYPVIVLFSILLVFGIFERLTPRPHIITYLFFALLPGILINYRYFDRNSYKRLYFIPVIFLLWANLHMGCVIGIGIFGIFLISEFIEYIKPGKFTSKNYIPLTKKEMIRILVIFLISVLAMMANPHGVMTYFYSLTSQANTKMLYEAVMEWISPFNSRFLGMFHSDIYIMFLAGIIPVMIYSFKKKDIFAGLISLLFAINSVRALRFTIDYELIVFPFVLASMSYFIDEIKSINVREFITRKPALKIILTIFMAFLIYSIPGNVLYHKYLTYARWAGTGIDENYYPVKMFDFIKENKINELGKKPFNTFECGGFFLWNFPGQKDFFDSRDLNDFIMNEYQVLISKLPGYENKVDEYGFDYAICVIPDIASEPSIMKQSIISYFSTNNTEWKLVYWNDHSLLFLKNLPQFAKIIDDNEYKYFTPYNLYYQKNLIEKGISEDKAEVLDEVNRKNKEDRFSIFLNNFLVLFRKKLL